MLVNLLTFVKHRENSNFEPLEAPEDIIQIHNIFHLFFALTMDQLLKTITFRLENFTFSIHCIIHWALRRSQSCGLVFCFNLASQGILAFSFINFYANL